MNQQVLITASATVGACAAFNHPFAAMAVFVALTHLTMDRDDAHVASTSFVACLFGLRLFYALA